MVSKLSFVLCFPLLHSPSLLSFAVFAVHVFLPFLVSSIDWWETEALNLAHGSSTLVFELGVEEIAAADGGDVEACVLEILLSV
jgi:hypothetical protein